MVAPQPVLPATPSVPSLGGVRRGILSSRPIVMKSPTLFGGGGRIPLQNLMRGIRTGGGLRKLNTTRQHLGTLA